MSHERIVAAGVTLHVVRAGDGQPVILLHGFPESWRAWRGQIGPLAAAGFSVLAPDLRGYNLSDRPAGREPYRLPHLVADVAALVRSTGWPRAHIVGHDWGGIVAWSCAGAHPELVDKLVILNAPHLHIYLTHVWRPPQLFRSWYLLFFLLPGLSEWALSARNFYVLRDMFARYPARPGAFPDDEIDECIRALARPGALTAALNYYRANLWSGALAQARSVRTDAPTLVIWGERDPALGTQLLDGLERFAPRLHIHRIPDASHWVQNEAPDEVNRVLLEFLTAQPR